MKHAFILFLFFGFTLVKSNAQVYHLNQMYLTVNSRPKPINTKMEITKDYLIFTSYVTTDSTADSTITQEKIVKNKNGAYIKTMVNNTAYNYEIALSDDKKEKKQNIVIVSQLIVPNVGERKSFFYKGKLIE